MPALIGQAASLVEVGRLCAICQTAIVADEMVGHCPGCDAPFHTECWDENGGCASYGCANMPQTVKDESPETPPSYWGMEEKFCPQCGRSIKVAALRCRHCGAVFDTRTPQSASEFVNARRTRSAVQSARGGATAVFITGVLPCTSPFTLLFGGIWYLRNRAAVAKLPAGYRVLCMIGLLSALVTTLCMIGAVVLHRAAALLGG